MTVVDDAPTVGDASVTLRYTFRETDLPIFAVSAQVGRETLFVSFRNQRVSRAAEEALTDLAETQADCLGEEECLDPVEVPEELSGETVTYESPLYDYTLTYDPAVWEEVAEDEDPDDPYDQLFLSSLSSNLALTGDPDYDEDELETCLDDYVRGAAMALRPADVEAVGLGDGWAAGNGRRETLATDDNGLGPSCSGRSRCACRYLSTALDARA